MTKWGIATVIVVVALLVVFGRHSDHRGVYKPVRPNVGDKANVTLSYQTLKLSEQDNINAVNTTKYIKRALVIECISKKNDICRFTVSDQEQSGCALYYVEVNYGTNNVKRQTVVRDTSGNIIPRSQLVDHMPVPFHDFLVFNESYFGKKPWKRQVLSNGLVAHKVKPKFITIYKGQVDDCFANTAMIYQTSQEWKYDEWLWHLAHGLVKNEGKIVYYFAKRTYPQPLNRSSE